jgi:positive phototaxis protein PixI
MDTALTRPGNSALAPTGNAYLKFQLNRQIRAVFSMRHVQEALVIPARRLTPMPNLPAPFLGLTNRRNRITWVLDLPQVLGLGTLDPNLQQYTLVLLQVRGITLALAVHRVDGMIRFDSDTIQPPFGSITPTLAPYLRGCVLQQVEQEEVVLVLDAEAIAQSPLLQRV